MNKSNFKKLALMGMVGGALVATQAPAEAAEGITTNVQLAGHSCSSCANKSRPATNANGCASKGGCANKTAPNANGCASKSSGCANKSSGCANRGNGRGYTADASTEMKDATARRIWTESELLNHLNDSGKAAYRNLTPEGKALALKLASTEQFHDKNEAVKAAERQTAGSNKNSTMNKNY